MTIYWFALISSSHRKKRQRPIGPPLEIPRSLSLPYGAAGHAAATGGGSNSASATGGGGGRVTRFASTGDESSAFAPAARITPSPTSEGVPRSPGTYSYSPPVDGGPLGGAEEGAGFYMLKKDSQRRQTIVKVMQEASEQLLSIWMERIRANLPPTSALLLKEEHLQQLLTAIITYVPEQNKAPLGRVLSQLKEALDYDGAALSQLQTALFLFQQSVMEILKRQNIKPHWMFALDNLVKQCCQAAVSILSPELAANIIGRNDDDEDVDEDDNDRASTTSGVSTTHSVARSATGQAYYSQPQHLSVAPQWPQLPQQRSRCASEAAQASQRSPAGLTDDTGDILKVFGQLGAAKEQTTNLVNTLVQSEKLYQNLLVSIIQSRDEQRNFVHGVVDVRGGRGASSGVHTSRGLVEQPVTKEDGDPDMIRWLENIGLDEESIMQFVKEKFTIEDVLQLVDRDDLKRLGLKLGYEVRVWTAIQRHRAHVVARQEACPEVGKDDAKTRQRSP